ncbi:MAG: hypothetical protein IPH79_11930 [Sphingomonadales bacterium]|nr:hypothetical protein [Sphingomonadales bacterium]
MPEWVGICIRFAQFASQMLLVGIAAFPLYALRSNERADATVNLALGALLPILAAIALCATVGGFIVMSANMMGVTLAEIDGTMLLSMVSETDAGRAALGRLAALVTALLVLAWRTDRTGFRLCAVAVLGAVSLSTLVWSGHAAATEGVAGTVHRVSDTVHCCLPRSGWEQSCASCGCCGHRTVQHRPADRQLRRAHLRSSGVLEPLALR